MGRFGVCNLIYLLCGLTGSCYSDSVITFGNHATKSLAGAGNDDTAFLIFNSRAVSLESIAKFGNVFDSFSNGGRFSNLKLYADRYNATVEELSSQQIAAYENDPSATQVRHWNELNAALSAACSKLVLFADSLLARGDAPLSTEESTDAGQLDALLQRVVSELEARKEHFRVLLTVQRPTDVTTQPAAHVQSLLRRKRDAQQSAETYTLVNISNCLLFYSTSIKIDLLEVNDENAADLENLIATLNLPATDQFESDSFAYCDQPEPSPSTPSLEQESITTENPEETATGTTEAPETTTEYKTTAQTEQTTEQQSSEINKKAIEELISGLPGYETLREILNEKDGEKNFAYIHLMYPVEKLNSSFNYYPAHVSILLGRLLSPASKSSAYSVPPGDAWYTVLSVNATFSYSEDDDADVHTFTMTFRLPSDVPFRLEAPFGYSYHCTDLQLYETDIDEVGNVTMSKRVGGGRIIFEDFQIEAFGDDGIEDGQFTDNVVDCDAFFTPLIFESLFVLITLIVGVLFGIVMLNGIGDRSSYPPFDRTSATDRERFRFVVNVPADELQ